MIFEIVQVMIFIFLYVVSSVAKVIITPFAVISMYRSIALGVSPFDGDKWESIIDYMYNKYDIYDSIIVIENRSPSKNLIEIEDEFITVHTYKPLLGKMFPLYKDVLIFLYLAGDICDRRDKLHEMFSSRVDKDHDNFIRDIIMDNWRILMGEYV